VGGLTFLKTTEENAVGVTDGQATECKPKVPGGKDAILTLKASVEWDQQGTILGVLSSFSPDETLPNQPSGGTPTQGPGAERLTPLR